MTTSGAETLTSEPEKKNDFPLTYEVEYPEGGLSRWKTLLRIFLIIPIAILAGIAFTTSTSIDTDMSNAAQYVGYATGTVAGSIAFATAFMILFRKKYPRWWFDFQLELARFTSRISVYASLQTDKYPSTDEQQGVKLEFEYPDVENDLNRVLPIFKWLLAIPHYIVLAIIGIAYVLVVIFTWFAIIITGKYPGRAVFDFVVGYQRWWHRVSAYTTYLVTDKYPPFSFK